MRPLAAQTAAGLRAENEAVRATRSSADGAVTVTVNVHGEIDRVDFGDAADGHSLDELGAALLGATRQAQAGAAREAAANVSAALGSDAPAAQALRTLVPDDDYDDLVPQRTAAVPAERTFSAPATRPLVRWDDDVEDDAGFSRT